MAVTRIGSGAGGTSTGAAVTFNGPAIATSDANTVVIVGVAISVSSNSSSTTCSVTYGGTAMTQLNLTLLGSSTNRNARGIYYLFNPGTGTKSCVVTPAGASTKAQVRCQAVAFSGVAAGGVGTVQDASATTHAPTSVTNGYDVRVLVNGATLSAPNQTQEYLAGASVSGDGDYMTMQSAAGTGSTISFTCTGTATNAGSSATALTPAANPKTETLTDNFDSGIGANWTAASSSVPASVTSSANAIRLDHSSSASQFNQLVTVSNYDLTGSYAYVKVVDFGDQSAGRAHDVYFMVETDSNNQVWIGAQAGSLFASKNVGGSGASIGSITLNYTQHRWWRIREASGTIYFDTAPDGTTWTNRWNLSNPFAVTSMKVWLAVANHSTGTLAASYAIYDNFNTTPVYAKTETLVDTFATKDTGKWTWSTNAASTSGKLALTSIAGSNESVATNVYYNMAGSSVAVKVGPIDTTSYAEFIIQSSGGSTNYIDMFRRPGTNDLVFRESVGGVSDSSPQIAYNSTTHAWWRVREFSGYIYWDTSPDGTVWTNQRSKATTVDYTAVIVQLSANTGAGVTNYDSVNAKTEYLQDNFRTKDTVKWGWIGAGATVSGGQAQFPVPSPNGDAHMSTPYAYDLTGSSVSVELVQTPALESNASGGTTAELLIYDTAFAKFVELMFESTNNTSNVRFRYHDTFNDDVSVTYDPVAHRFFRIRELGGTIYWDTSPDGVTWTNQRSKATGAIDFTNVWPLINGGRWGSGTAQGTAIWDNVNLIPMDHVSDQFNTADAAKWDYQAGATVAGGQLRLDVNASGTGDIEGYRFNPTAYTDLTDSSATIQIVQFPPAGSDNQIAIHLRTQDPGPNYNMFGFEWDSVDGKTYTSEWVGGQSNWDAGVVTTDGWWRIRESAGTVYWDTSADGVTWTNRRSKAWAINRIDHMYTQLYAQGSTAGTAIIEGYNTFPKIENLVDTFATKDTAKWQWNGASAVSGGQLTLPVNSSYADYIQSVGRYSLIGSSFVAKMVQRPNVGNGTTNTGITIRAASAGPSDRSTFIVEGNFLIMREHTGTTDSDTSVAYNSTNHKWFRIRESGGTIYWDTSPDGTTWTNQRSRVTSLNYGSVQAEIYTGYYGTEPSPGTAIWDSVNAKTEYLQDGFASQDYAKWTYYGGSNATGGQLSIPVNSSYGDGIGSIGRYDMIGSSIQAELVQRPNVGNGTTDALLQVSPSAGNSAALIVESTNLILRETVTSANNDTTVTYDPVAHRFLRLRESAGTIYWDTSPEGIVWTNRRSRVTGLNYSDVKIDIYTGYYGTEPSPGTAIWDNLNLVPVANLTDTFASLDTNKWTAGAGTTVTGGQVSEVVNSSYTGTLVSKQRYDLRESAIYVNLAALPNAGNGTTSAMLHLQPGPSAPDNTNAIQAYWTNNLTTWEFRAGDVQLGGHQEAYSSTNHKFFRIRESAGIIYFDTAPADGVTWTNLKAYAYPATYSLGSLLVSLHTGYYGTEPSPGGPVLWDNLNLAPAPTGRTDKQGMLAMF